MIDIKTILESCKSGKNNRTKEDVLIKLFEEVGEVAQEISKDNNSSYRKYDKLKVNEEIVDSLISLIDLLYVVNEEEIDLSIINGWIKSKCDKWIKNATKQNIKSILEQNNVGMIMASSQDYGIGFKNELPWERIRQDMIHFKTVTLGRIVIMGANTYKSFKEKPLKNRFNIVVSKNTYKSDEKEFTKIHPNLNLDNEFTLFVEDLKDAFLASKMILDTNPFIFNKKETNIWIIGGAKLYESAFEFVNDVWITDIHEHFRNDTLFDYNRFINGETFKLMNQKLITRKETLNYDITIKQYKRI